jgi:hypothetical protein
VVEAHIVSLPDNAGLARSMEVGVVHQADGYELVTTVEQALEQQEQQQRAEAVEAAAQNADAPTL